MPAQGFQEYSFLEPCPDSLEHPGARWYQALSAEWQRPTTLRRWSVFGWNTGEILSSAEMRGHIELLEALVFVLFVMCHNRTAADLGLPGCLANRFALAIKLARHPGPHHGEDLARLTGLLLI